MPQRPLKQLISELIQIAHELEEFETNLTQFMAPGPEAPPPDPLAPRKYNLKPKVKLSKRQKEQIRLLHAQGKTSQELMDLYGANKLQIYAILHNNLSKVRVARSN